VKQNFLSVCTVIMKQYFRSSCFHCWRKFWFDELFCNANANITLTVLIVSVSFNFHSWEMGLCGRDWDDSYLWNKGEACFRHLIHFPRTSVLKLNCSKKLNFLLSKQKVPFLSLTCDQCKEAQLKHCNSIKWRVQIVKFLLCTFFHCSLTCCLIILDGRSTLISIHPICILPS
jgi:hypothetical protein